MALMKSIIAFAMFAAFAAHLTSADKNAVHRSLASLPRSLIQDPRTVQRKTSQIPPLMALNSASGKRTQSSSTVGNNQVNAATSSEMQSTSKQQHVGNLRQEVPTESRRGSETRNNQVNAATSSEMQSASMQQHVGNLRQVVPAESRRGSATSNIVSRAVATTGRAMTVDQGQGLLVPMATSKIRSSAQDDVAHPVSNSIQPDISSNQVVSATLKGSVPQAQAMGNRDSAVAVTKASLSEIGRVEPVVPMVTSLSKPVGEKSLSTREAEKDEDVPIIKDMAQDEKEDARSFAKLLRDSEPLPGQFKVDELLKAHRGDRDVDDVSNKDTEKERFFRLMYGRSKPNKFVEY